MDSVSTKTATVIHPAAIVDRRAELADGVRVGPGCVIEGPVSIGAGTELIAHVHIRGPAVVGCENVIYPFVCIGFEPQDRKYRGQTAGVVIGDRNLLRESFTMHCASQDEHPTRIGDDNFLMTNSHIGHDTVLGSRCTLASGALIGGHCQVFDDVNLGGNGALHQFCRCGRLSFLGGISAVAKDLPPFTMASGVNNVIGLNLIGLRRGGVSTEAVDVLNAAFKTLYLAGHSVPTAVKLLHQKADAGPPGAQLIRELAEFTETSERGLVPHSITKLHKHITR
jgi:UDP-N-acetylglucosamine acyltransferase